MLKGDSEAIETVAGVGMAAMLVVFLAIAFIGGLGVTYNTQVRTGLERLAAIDSAHVIEECFGLGGPLERDFLDENNGKDADDIISSGGSVIKECGAKPGFDIRAQVKDMSTGETWDFGYEQDDPDFSEAVIFTRIKSGEDYHVGTIRAQADIQKD